MVVSSLTTTHLSPHPTLSFNAKVMGVPSRRATQPSPCITASSPATVPIPPAAPDPKGAPSTPSTAISMPSTALSLPTPLSATAAPSAPKAPRHPLPFSPLAPSTAASPSMPLAEPSTTKPPHFSLSTTALSSQIVPALVEPSHCVQTAAACHYSTAHLSLTVQPTTTALEAEQY